MWVLVEKFINIVCSHKKRTRANVLVRFSLYISSLHFHIHLFKFLFTENHRYWIIRIRFIKCVTSHFIDIRLFDIGDMVTDSEIVIHLQNTVDELLCFYPVIITRRSHTCTISKFGQTLMVETKFSVFEVPTSKYILEFLIPKTLTRLINNWNNEDSKFIISLKQGGNKLWKQTDYLVGQF